MKEYHKVFAFGDKLRVDKLCVCQHAVVPLSGHQKESAAGRVAGERAAGVHHRGGGSQADHPHVAEEVPQTNPSRMSSTHTTHRSV